MPDTPILTNPLKEMMKAGKVALGMNVRLARSSLLPQVGSTVSQTFTREETAEASFGTQPERLREGGLSLSVPV